MESQNVEQTKVISSEYCFSDLVIYSREALTKTCYEILSNFSKIQCIDSEMTEKKFLCCVELSRKTNLPADLIEILSERREHCKKEHKPNLNTYYRILVYQARLYNEKSKKLSSLELRRIINNHCSSNKIAEPKNLSIEEFILLIRFAQNTPLTAEEIEITVNYLNDFSLPHSKKLEISDRPKYKALKYKASIAQQQQIYCSQCSLGYHPQYQLGFNPQYSVGYHPQYPFGMFPPQY